MAPLRRPIAENARARPCYRRSMPARDARDTSDGGAGALARADSDGGSLRVDGHPSSRPPHALPVPRITEKPDAAAPEDAGEPTGPTRIVDMKARARESVLLGSNPPGERTGGLPMAAIAVGAVVGVVGAVVAYVALLR